MLLKNKAFRLYGLNAALILIALLGTQFFYEIPFHLNREGGGPPVDGGLKAVIFLYPVLLIFHAAPSLKIWAQPPEYRKIYLLLVSVVIFVTVFFGGIVIGGMFGVFDIGGYSLVQIFLMLSPTSFFLGVIFAAVHGVLLSLASAAFKGRLDF